MFLAVDKPSRITSFDVVAALKRIFPKQKIWHSGTLDPLATGLMLVAVGLDTKNLTQLIGLDKSYITTIDFSKDSDTRDLEYRDILTEYKMVNWKLEIGPRSSAGGDWKLLVPPTEKQLQAKLDLLVPEYELPLPAFSAKKVNGKRFYTLAREGKAKEEMRVMKISKYKILSYGFPLLKLEVHVGSWTYIRSIAHWLGKEFGLWWIVAELRRISIGKYEIPKNLDQEVVYHKKEKAYPIKYTVMELIP